MAKNKISYFNVFIHWKQGDDFHAALEKADGNVVQGLRNWADYMSAGAECVREIAGALEGIPVKGEGDTHHIGFHIENASDELIEKLCALPGVNRDEWCEEEEAEYEEVPDEDDDE